MGRFTVVSLGVVLLLGCLVASATAQSATGINAYEVYFNAPGYDYDMYASEVLCREYDGDKPYEWRSKYNWTAFCGPQGPHPPESCGSCLKVTNVGTGDQTIVRIVEACNPNNSGLDLDKPVFDQLDTDGQGMVVGHLIVNYEFVDCHDDDDDDTDHTSTIRTMASNYFF